MHLKTVIKSCNALRNNKSMLYVIATLIAYGISYFQSFLIAYLFSVDNYGVYVLIISIFSIGYSVFMFGLGSSIIKFFSEGVDLKIILSSVLIIWFFISFFFNIIFFISSFCFSNVGDYLPISSFNLIVFASSLYAYGEINSNLYVAINSPLKLGGYLIFSRLSIFISLMISYHLFIDVIDVVCFGLFFGSVLSFLYTLLSNSKYLYNLEINNSFIYKVFRFSLPLSFNSISNFGFSHGFKILSSTILNFNQLGVFDLISKISNVFYLLVSSITKSKISKAYKDYDNNENIDWYSQLIFRYSIYLIILIFITNIPFLFWFKDGAFLHGLYILPIVLLGQFFLLLSSKYYIILSSDNKNYKITISVLLGSLLSVGILLIVNYYEMPSSLFTVSLALLLAYLVQLFLMKRFSKI